MVILTTTDRFNKHICDICSLIACGKRACLYSRLSVGDCLSHGEAHSNAVPCFSQITVLIMSLQGFDVIPCFGLHDLGTPLCRGYSNEVEGLDLGTCVGIENGKFLGKKSTISEMGRVVANEGW